MSDLVFYYDETEHSRRINYQTVSASNYYDNFITVIVGWDRDREEDIRKKYDDFENKYSERKNAKGELKSTTLQQKKFQYGLASQDKNNILFIRDFLSIIDEDFHVYFSVSSKIEYIVFQLFSDYKNCLFIDADAMKYSITKVLNVYRPENVIDCLCNSPNKFVDELISFFKKCIDHNRNSGELKKQENQAFEEIISYLENVSVIPKDEWNYRLPFEGFLKYLKEESIGTYRLILDKEGSPDTESKTLKAAKEIGIENVSEGDSSELFGLRIADMLVGIIAKLMKALRDSLCYHSFEEANKKKILDNKWFDLNEMQFETYKRLSSIICKWDHAWYKSYAGNYSDDLLSLISLFQYIDHFEAPEQIKSNLLMQGEYFNGFVCDQLKQYFDKRRNKLPIEHLSKSDDEFFLNQKGAKVFFDVERQPALKIDTSIVVEVLSIGMSNAGRPLVTILKNGQPVCCRLPVELSKWAQTLIGFANMGENLFPTRVRFTKTSNHYYADIL